MTTESPTSITYSIISPNGFPALLTIRDDDFSKGTEPKEIGLSGKMTKIEKWLEDHNYKPQIKQQFGAKKEVDYVQGKVCPKCKGRLIKKKTGEGKEFHQCENKKWDFLTKTNKGTCDFTDWLNSPQTSGLTKAEEMGDIDY